MSQDRERQEDFIQLHEIVGIFRRNLTILGSAILIGGILGSGLGFVLQPKYKATAILNIQSSYFGTPMAQDIIATVHDPGEQNARRMALLRLSLNNEFLNQLGEKYGVFKYPATDPYRTVEVEAFLKGIEFFAISPTNFQIAASSNTGQKAYDMTEDVLNQMITTLYEERYSSLLRTQLALKNNLRALSNGIRGISVPSGDQDTESMRQSLAAMNTEIEILQNRFSPQHPRVIRLKEQASRLENEIGSGGGGSGRTSRVGPSAGQAMESPTSEKSAKELYDELLRKLNYLNIVIEMEKDPKSVDYITVIEKPVLPAKPFSPKKRVLASVGLGAGFLIGLILAVFLELKRGTFAPPDNTSRSLDVPFLGVLPALAAGGKAGAVTYQSSLLLEAKDEEEAPPPPASRKDSKKKG